MCQQCVDRGEMSQEQWNGVKAKLYGEQPRVDLKGVLDELFDRVVDGETETKPDRAVRVLLDIVSNHTGQLEDANLDTRDEAGQAATADTLAMQLHFDQTPQALAYALGVIAMRYQDILEQWAYQYMIGVKNGSWTMDTYTASTPEARAALTAAAED
jgi:hypothetical protein